MGDHAVIRMMNTSSQETTLYKGTKIGQHTPLHSLIFVDTDLTVTKPQNSPIPDVDFSSCNLTPPQTKQLQQLLFQCVDLFVSPGGPLGCTNVVRHAIQTSGSPIQQPMCHLPVALKETMDSQVETMLQQNVMRPSCSPWSSPVVMVKKLWIMEVLH